MSNVSFSPVPPDALHDSKRTTNNGGDPNIVQNFPSELSAEL